MRVKLEIEVPYEDFKDYMLSAGCPLSVILHEDNDDGSKRDTLVTKATLVDFECVSPPLDGDYIDIDGNPLKCSHCGSSDKLGLPTGCVPMVAMMRMGGVPEGYNKCGDHFTCGSCGEWFMEHAKKVST